jgi:cytochrome d ubiquinol oxidase subunit II
MKTEGELQDRAFCITRVALFTTLGFIVAVSVSTPFLQGHYWRRWFTFPNIVLTAPVPVAVTLFSLGLIRSLRHRDDNRPFVLSLCLFLVTFGGLGLSVFPYVVPESVTIWEEASPLNSQLFVIVGVALLVPIVLAYTAHSYRIFRGKVQVDAGYHA